MPQKSFLVDINLNQNQLVLPRIHNLASAPGTPVGGQLYYNTGTKILACWNETSWISLMGAGSTNLSLGTVTSTTMDVDSDTGTDATLIAATTTNAGILSAAKWNEIVANNSKVTNVSTNLSLGTITATTMNVNSSDGTNVTLVEANTTQAGLLGSDKWDEIVTNTSKAANVTTNLTVAYSTTTFTIESSDGTDAVVAQAIAAGNAGAMSGADKTKIDGIEAGADKTDSTNVNAAGATMNADTTLAGNGYFLDEDDMTSDDATKVASQQSIKAYVDALLAANDAMIFKGTIGSGGTIEIAAFNSLTTYDLGWAYKVITAGTIKGVVAEVGDMFVSTVDRTGGSGVDADWVVLQTNIDGAVIGPASATDSNVVMFDGTSGKLIKDSSLTLSGSNTGDQTLASLGATGKYAASFGNGSLTTFTISEATHGLGTDGDYIVQARLLSSEEVEEVEVSINTTTGLITINTNSAPASNDLRIIVIG